MTETLREKIDRIFDECYTLGADPPQTVFQRGKATNKLLILLEKQSDERAKNMFRQTVKALERRYRGYVRKDPDQSLPKRPAVQGDNDQIRSLEIRAQTKAIHCRCSNSANVSVSNTSFSLLIIHLQGL